MSAQDVDPDLLKRAHSRSSEIIQGASNWRQMIEDFRPLEESLDWRLAETHWIAHGVASFINGKVPWLINNDGQLSADAAAVLFANCMEAPPGPEGITVLELGAGTGLFARYLLDEFQALCERHSRDFYERLTYVVTDRSAASVAFWRASGVFANHGRHVRMLEGDAAHPKAIMLQPLRAAFCNYILDTLPSAALRWTPAGWEELWARTWITRDEEVLRHFTHLSIDQMRTVARSEDLKPLLPVLPMLETERSFFPLSDRLPVDLSGEALALGCTFAYNHGALGCLKELLATLDPWGFVLVHDYGSTKPEGSSQDASGQWFGPATAMALNFFMLESCCGASVVKPDGDGDPMHARLFHRGATTATCTEFLVRFAPEKQQFASGLEARARAEVAGGNWQQALRTYQTAVEHNPRNWRLLGEAAEFLGTHLRSYPQALDLVETALGLNPWYSQWLWNLKGDLLARLGRHEEAHECHLQAETICPEDPRTQVLLAGSFLRRGEPASCLRAVAEGLAHDRDCQFRHLLTEKQEAALASLAIRWTRERETAARRQAAGLPPPAP